MSLADTARSLLIRQGEPVVLMSSAPAFDPVTGAPIAAGPETSVTVSAYPGRYMKGEIDGSLIQAADIRLTAPVIDPRPEVGWSAMVDSTTYRVMDVRPVRQAGQDQVLILQLRAN